MGLLTVRIVLLPVNTYDRRNNAEAYENSVFETIDEARKVFGDKGEIYPLTDFMDMCNDEEFNPDDYWVTYIAIKN
jgi:hypothetical protein